MIDQERPFAKYRFDARHQAAVTPRIRVADVTSRGNASAWRGCPAEYIDVEECRGHVTSRDW
jgi:hypothetical protein